MRTRTALQNTKGMTITALLLVVLLFAAGCGAGGGGGTGGGNKNNTPATLQQLQITPANPAIAAGTTTNFAVTGIYSDNSTKNLTNSVSYKSSNTTIATITNKGVATGLKSGSVTITVTEPDSNKTASTKLSVTEAELTGLQLESGRSVLPKGVTLQLSAVGLFTDLSAQDLTDQVTWSSSQPSIADVSNAPGSKGIVTAFAPGSVIFTARHEPTGLEGTISMTISGAELVSIQVSPTNPSIAKGVVQQFQAIGLYTDNSTLDLTTQVTWSSSDEIVAGISNDPGTEGYTLSLKEGSSTITATFPGTTISGSTLLTVTAAELVSLQVSPANPSQPLGLHQQFSAVGLYSDNSTQDLTNVVTWSSGNEAVAVISNALGSKGDASSITVGSANITATYPGTAISDTTLFTVTDAALVSIRVDPVNPSIAKGLDQQFTSTGLYTDNSTRDITDSVTWTSSNGAVADISNVPGSIGEASALEVGESTITASFPGAAISGSTLLTVTDAELVSLQVNPINPSKPLGLHQQFSAIGFYTDNSTQDLTDVVTWSSGNEGVAVVSNAPGSQGDASTLSTGAANIIATYPGTAVSDSTLFTVTDAELVSIQVDPVNPSLAKGLEQQFTATGLYTDNSTKNITDSVTWSSSNTAVSEVSNLPGNIGEASALDVGNTTITATFPGSSISGSSLLTVTPAELVSIQVSADAPSVANGLTVQMTAMGIYTDNTTQDITGDVTWSSGDELVAVVSNNPAPAGLVSTLGEGTALITAVYPGTAVSDSFLLTVTPAELVSITVTPADLSVPLGLTQQYSAIGTYTDNSTLDISSQVAWSSSDPGIADVSNGAGSIGLASTISQGNVTISAVFPGTAISGSTGLTVDEAALVSLEIAPVDDSAPKGLTKQFSATGTYTDNSTLDVTDSVTWESSSPTIASISNVVGSQGLASALNVGSTVISATYPGTAISTSTNFEVTPAVLVSIQITPINPQVVIGRTKQLNAVGTYSDNSTQIITASVTWSSMNEAIATVSNAPGSQGLASGIALGTVVVKAIDPATSIEGSANLKVKEPPKVYVSNLNASQFSIIKTQDWTVQQTITGILRPAGVAVSVDGNFVYVGNLNGNAYLYKINTTDFTWTTIPLSAAPRSVAVHPSGEYIYAVTNGLSVIRTSDNTVTTVAGVTGAYDAAVSPDGNYVYLAMFSNNAVAVVRTSDHTLVKTIALSSSPLQIIRPMAVAVRPDGQFVYTVNQFNGTISVIRTSDHTLVSNVSIGGGSTLYATDLAVTPDGRYVYETNNNTGNVKVMDTTTNTIVATVTVGFAPQGIAASPDNDYIFVANQGGNTISVIDIATNTVVRTITGQPSAFMMDVK